jgi:hypothetical protein
MNRAECSARYRALTAEDEALISRLEESAAAKRGTFDAYEDLSFAASVAQANDNFRTILSVLDTSAAGSSAPYGNADAVQALVRNAARAIVIAVKVDGDVDGRLAASFKSCFDSRGFRTSTESAESGYTLDAALILADADLKSQKYKYVQYSLKATLRAAGGEELLSIQQEGREGHLSEPQAKERALRSAEKLVTQGDFAKSFDRYLGPLSVQG